MTRAEIIARLRAGETGREMDCRLYALLVNPQVMTFEGDARGRRPAEYMALADVVAGGFEDWPGLAAIAGAPAYTESVDAALAAPIAEGWRITSLALGDKDCMALASNHHTQPSSFLDGTAPTLAPAIMVAKMLTFEVGE